MSRLTIEERFTLNAHPDRVWDHLTDPERTVVCLPGASLEEVVDERTYRGRVTVQVGPVTVVYAGEAVFEERDPGERRIRMKAEGREVKGSGSASMVMRSRIEPAPGGGSAVTVEADVEVAGKIVRFGRGMIERVSGEIFKEFTSCLAGLVETEGATEEDTREDPAQPAPANALTFAWRALRGWLRELRDRLPGRPGKGPRGNGRPRDGGR